MSAKVPRAGVFLTGHLDRWWAKAYGNQTECAEVDGCYLRCLEEAEAPCRRPSPRGALQVTFSAGLRSRSFSLRGMPAPSYSIYSTPRGCLLVPCTLQNVPPIQQHQAELVAACAARVAHASRLVGHKHLHRLHHACTDARGCALSSSMQPVRPPTPNQDDHSH